MAQRIILLDDLDESEGASTVTFALDGNAYEVDLVAKNRAKLEKALEPFLAVARPLTRGFTSDGATRQRRPRGTAPAKPAGIDYTDPERYGQIHRGRVTEEEAALVRANRQHASKNRQEQGHPPIDWKDEKERARYGITD